MTSPEPRRGSCELLRIHHVAFAHDDTGDGEAVHAGLERLFGLCCSEEDGPGFTERTYRIGELALQVLCSTGPGTIERFVSRRGAALHHVAVEVGDIDSALRSLREQGVRLIDEEPRPGGGQTRIAFVHPSQLGGLLLELVEVQRK